MRALSSTSVSKPLGRLYILIPYVVEMVDYSGFCVVVLRAFQLRHVVREKADY